MNNEIKDNLIIWVTNPNACGNIVRVGVRLAKEKDAEPVIVNIQKPFTRAMRDIQIETVEKLESAARSVGCDLTIVYSDNSMEAAFSVIKKLRPIAMVTGMPATRGKESFIDQIYIFSSKVPLYMVDNSGNAIRTDL